MRNTPYADVNGILVDLFDHLKQILGERLVGLYLYGSLVTGDFDVEISDIDLLAVTTRDLGDTEFRRLHTMHDELAAAYSDWDGRIEVQYLSASGLRNFKTRRSPIGAISPGEPFHMKDAGIDWLINWYMVRDIGWVLYGPDPRTLIPPISREEFVAASRAQGMYWVDRVDQPQDRTWQSYVTLTMCRVLYACTKGEQSSKLHAAFWVQTQFPQWSPLIQNALVWRKGWQDEDVDHAATFPEAAAFIHFVVDAISST